MTYAYDPELLPFVAELADIDLADLPATRAWHLAMFSTGSIDILRDPSVDVRERRIPGPAGEPDITVRIHTPSGRNTLRAAMVYYHGGAFVLGNAAGSDITCSYIAAQVNAIVIAVDYRLAPEHPFPAGLEDCYAGLSWVHDHAAELGIDPQRIAVGGESAGGGLAAGTALLARDRGGPALAMQLLISPELDDRLQTPSMIQFVDTPCWSQPNAVWSWRYYLQREPDADADTSPYAAPARAEDLTGLPTAYLCVFEFDPLRDENLIYAQRLVQAGVPTEMHLYRGTFHGCTNALDLAITDRINDDTTGALNRILNTTHTPAAIS